VNLAEMTNHHKLQFIYPFEIINVAKDVRCKYITSAYKTALVLYPSLKDRTLTNLMWLCYRHLETAYEKIMCPSHKVMVTGYL